MKLILLLLMMSVSSSLCIGQSYSIDIYEEGMAECLSTSQWQAVTSVVEQIDSLITIEFGSEQPYQTFTKQFCAGEIDSDFFRLDTSTVMYDRVVALLKTGDWFYDDEKTDDEKIDGVEYIVEPPAGTVIENPTPKREYVKLKPDAKFVQCSHIYSMNKVISTVFGRYQIYHVANSNIRLCGVESLLMEEDYYLPEVRYFIAIDVIVQKMAKVNNLSI